MDWHWALYDPSFLSGDKTYWTWRAPELSLPLLERFYYDIASKNLPPEPNSLGQDDVWGGIAAIAGKWIAAYRFFNGGRDTQGRQGRFVLVTAWIPADAIGGDWKSCADVFCHRIFQDAASIASTTIPVPAPAELSTAIRVGNPDMDRSFADLDVFADACRQFIETMHRGDAHVILRMKGETFQVERFEPELKNQRERDVGDGQPIVKQAPPPRNIKLPFGLSILLLILVAVGAVIYFMKPTALIVENRDAEKQGQTGGDVPETQPAKTEDALLPEDIGVEGVGLAEPTQEEAPSATPDGEHTSKE